jgi:hypothetical protein
MKASIFENLIRISAGSVLLGRGIQHLFWETPYRHFLWSRQWMEKPAKILFGLDWNTYLLHPVIDLFWTRIIQGIGLLFILIGAILLSNHKPVRIVQKWGARLSLLFLMPLTYLSYLGYWIHLPQVFEFTLQLTPLWIIALGRLQVKDLWTNKNRVKLAISLTFAAHGFYAMGFSAVPHSFVQMTTAILGINNEAAYSFLSIAGLLDFVLAVGIWMPFYKIRIWSLLYAIFWGFFTAFARIWANVYGFDVWNGLAQWGFEFLVRIAHFVLPLAILLTYETKKNAPEKSRAFLYLFN